VLARDLTRAVREAMAAHDFRSTRNRMFRRRDGEFIEVIELQPSTAQEPDSFVFTINMGIHCDTLARFFSDVYPAVPFVVPLEVGATPEVADCHWRERLGQLLDQPEDRWWRARLAADGEIDGGVGEAIDLLEQRAVPLLDRLSDLDQLREAIERGTSPALSRAERALFASVLNTLAGDHESAARLVRRFRDERPGDDRWQAIADEHSRALSQWPS